ncbi:MAG: hypothetical protein M1816_001349 [Peltula sp. TS41687]|nr:MAG: hypothetical protein M1816_001349 [Peltula sp. TS41687]
MPVRQRQRPGRQRRPPPTNQYKCGHFFDSQDTHPQPGGEDCRECSYEALWKLVAKSARILKARERRLKLKSTLAHHFFLGAMARNYPFKIGDGFAPRRDACLSELARFEDVCTRWVLWGEKAELGDETLSVLLIEP